MFNKDLLNLNLMQGESKPFANKKINFPTSYDLKIIVDSTIPSNKTQHEFEEIAKELKIPHKGWSKKESRKGTYVSYSTRIHLKDEPTMLKLYEDLKKISGLKMAI